jgi:hypothetical protein
MHSYAQVFSHLGTTLGTLLRSPPRIYFSKEFSSLPTHVLDKRVELPKSRIKQMFSKHSFGRRSIVQIFHEDHVTSVTKSVGLLEVEVMTSVVNGVMHPSNLDALSLVILRPFLFSAQSALQQLQLALHLYKKLGRLYKSSVTSCQKLLQPCIDTNRMSVG